MPLMAHAFPSFCMLLHCLQLTPVHACPLMAMAPRSLSSVLQGDDFVLTLMQSGLANSSSCLSVLDLSENQITCLGACQIAGTLELAGPRCVLRQLDLAFNKIGNEGAVALASMVASVPSVAGLELEQNVVGARQPLVAASTRYVMS